MGEQASSSGNGLAKEFSCATPPLLSGSHLVSHRTHLSRQTKRAAALCLSVLVLIIGASLLVRMNLPLPRCVFKAVTGYPCFTCGSTRSLLALGRFHFAEAFRFNPLLASLCLSSPAWLMGSLLPVKFRMNLAARRAGATHSKWFWALLVALVLGNWAYLLIFLPD